MSTTNSTAALEAARALVPRIEADAVRIDAERELPSELAHALGDAGLFWLLLPASLGGAELELPVYLEVVELLAKADASVAWCVNQGAVFATVTRHLPPDAACSIWRTPRDVVANGPPPFGRAVPVDGGYRLSGRWSFSSGCRHATWLSGIALIEAEEGRPPELEPRTQRSPVMLLLPPAEAELIDVWHVRGLRGTGSQDFRVDDVFVPRAHSVSWLDPVLEPGPLYRLSIALLFACGFAAVALGVARGALDEMLEVCGGKTPRFARSRIRERGSVQLEAARAEATWRAARAFLFESVGSVWSELERGETPTREQRVLLRLASTHTIREATRATQAAYELAGTDAIYESRSLQRRFQDAHVITQHVQARTAHYESAGRFYLGLDPDLEWM